MEYITTAAITVVFTVLIVLFYKYVINPKYVKKVESMTQCPDRWNYNSVTKVCEPAYETHCLPFNPDANTLDTLAAKCTMARECGTVWSGMCG